MSAVQHRYTLDKGCVLLADVSFSMDTRTRSGRRRIDHLAEVLGYVLSRVRLQKLICFSSVPVEIEIGPQVKLPEPNGSTALELALFHLEGLETKPERVIVLCDGEPNSPATALAAARRLGVPIDAYFIGDDGDDGVAFMAELAAAGAPGGRSGRFGFDQDAAVLGEVLRLTAAGGR